MTDHRCIYFLDGPVMYAIKTTLREVDILRKKERFYFTLMHMCDVPGARCKSERLNPTLFTLVQKYYKHCGQGRTCAYM